MYNLGSMLTKHFPPITLYTTAERPVRKARFDVRTALSFPGIHPSISDAHLQQGYRGGWASCIRDESGKYLGYTRAFGWENSHSRCYSTHSPDCYFMLGSNVFARSDNSQPNDYESQQSFILDSNVFNHSTWMFSLTSFQRQSAPRVSNHTVQLLSSFKAVIRSWNGCYYNYRLTGHFFSFHVWTSGH